MRRGWIICAVVCSLCLLHGVARAEEAMSWIDCIAEAKENNPDLISAALNINQQKAERRIAVSGLLPQIDGDANATKNESSSSIENYSYGITGSQIIFDGLKTINDVKGAATNIKAAKEGYRFTSLVQQALLTAFLMIVFAGWAVEVSLFSILLATLFSFAVGILFGIWPAHQASKLNPIEALRYE